MVISYDIKGVKLDVQDLRKLHNYFECACTAEYLLDNHYVENDTEAFKVAGDIRKCMDKYNLYESEAIEMYFDDDKTSFQP